MKKAIFLILDKFADWEPAFLSMALKGEMTEEYRVLFASRENRPIGSIGGMTVQPDMALADIPADADALILIGADGSWRSDAHEDIRALAESFLHRGKVVAAICDAAWWLSATGLTAGVRHTANDPEELETAPGYANRAGYVEQDSVRDGRVVTANGNAPVAFAADVLRALGVVSEEKIQEFFDFYTMGFHAAMRKYGYVAG